MSEKRQTTTKYLMQQGVIIAILALSLFVSAGDFGWVRGWGLMAI